MKSQLIKAWQTHQAMNELVLNNIPESALDLSLSSRGGRNIRQQFIHMHQVRLQWLELSDKELFSTQTALDKAAPVDKSTLLKALAASSGALLELFSKSWDQEGKIKNFKAGLIPMLCYFVSHESHHRGNILLTIKQSGEKIPDNVKWGLWEWSR